MFANIVMLVMFVSHMHVADALIENKQNVEFTNREGQDEIKGNHHNVPESLLYTKRRLATLFHKTSGTDVSKGDDAGAKNPNMPTSPNMAEVMAEFKGRVTVSCPNDHTLLSCGISNTQMETHDKYRYAVPISSSTCECQDHYGARCHAWCSNAVQYMFVAKALGKFVFNVYCPPGYKVAGCHIESPKSAKAEAWRSHRPTDDGNGCICYDYYGAYCYASCISNIESHEVRSAYGEGHGLVKVGCSSPDLYVLGCGMESSSKHHAEYFREFRVYYEHECACYDNFGTRCYVTCGKFK